MGLNSNDQVWAAYFNIHNKTIHLMTKDIVAQPMNIFGKSTVKIKWEILIAS